MRHRRDRDHSKCQRVARDPFDGFGSEVGRRDPHNDAGLSADADNAEATRASRRTEAEPDKDPDRAEGRQRYRRSFRACGYSKNKTYFGFAPDQPHGSDQSGKESLRDG